jgi:TolB-like protein/Tfp pilus assembly protein PilF
LSAEPERIQSLIDSVADGGPVDWDAIAAATSDERQRRLIGHLRLVAGLAEVHRTTPLDESTPISSPATDTGHAIGQWGHLQLLERIGDGTFGDVYRARDQWLDREVALKLLKPATAGNAPIDRILHEARTLARVRHPNVVTVYGADVHDGRVGLWMEYVHGRTLFTMLAAQGPSSANEAAIVGQELCRALGAVHAAGLVHRDVKAQNVMRESGGRLLLMDFGAGQRADGVRTSRTRPTGTPLYLAPEILRGEQATVQSDVYALGVLLYYLVTRGYPVSGASMDDLIAAHARGERRRLRDARPDLPDAFVTAVEGALEPDPARRFATTGEMLPALAGVTSESVSVRRASVRPARWQIWRWKPLNGLAAAALVLAVAVAGTYLRTSRPESGVAYAAVELVAVLPLHDLSGTEAYLADGLTDALTQELSTSGPLKVVSRTSVARLLAQNATLPQIVTTLNADAVVEGSLLRTGRDIRVNVRVSRAGSDATVWARTFERTASDLVSLQQEVARAIASELRVALYPRAVERWRQPGSVDEVAYDAYLRGRHERRTGTQAGMRSALEHFQKAIARAPKYAPPRVSLAEAYLRLGQDFAAMPATEAARLAKAAVADALDIDDSLAQAHSVLATIKYQVDWDFAGAEQQFQRAIELDPSFVEAHLDYAAFLYSRGRFDEALRQVSLARELDPLSPMVADTAGRAHYFARQYDRALAEVRRATQLEPTAIGGYVGLGRVLTAMGRHDEAIAEFKRASASHAGHPYLEAEIAQAEIAAGRVADGRRRLARLRARMTGPASQVTPYMLALVNARIDSNEAFTWLEREFESRSARILMIKVDPRIDPLRSDPRFPAFLKKLGLEP